MKDDSYRHSALEVMVSLCENAAGMVKKKAASFIPPLRKFIMCLFSFVQVAYGSHHNRKNNHFFATAE